MIEKISVFGIKHCIDISNIHQSVLYRWNACKDIIQQQPKNSKKCGSGRKPVLGGEIEDEIATWIQQCNQTDLLVNHKSVKDYCQNKYGDISTFSKDWFRRFKDRFKLSCRGVTSFSYRPKGAGSSTVLEESIKIFKQRVSTVEKTLLNMDETPVWFDMPSKNTVTKKGTKHVALRATSNEKKRITVVLACKSNGEKIPPVVILKSKYRGVVPDGMQVWYQSKAWMNSKLSLQWLDQFYSNDTHLLWDSFSGHKSVAVKERLETVYHTFIPPRTTAVCQPLDVGVNKPFKDKLKDRWNAWSGHGMGLTKTGCWKSASVEQLLKWIHEAWQEITTVTILNSFRKALVE